MEATFFRYHLSIKIDIVVIIYYLKQVFCLLYDRSVTPAEALLIIDYYIIIIDSCIV